MRPPPPCLLGSGIPATRGRPQPLRGNALRPPPSAEGGRYQACLLASRAVLAQMAPNAVTARGEPRGEPVGGLASPRAAAQAEGFHLSRLNGRILPPSQVPVPRERPWQDP